MEKLAPPLQLLNLSMSYLVPRSLHVITELGVADHLDKEPKDAVALADATGALPDRLHRLMRLLAVHGIFEMASESRFRHNEISRLLRSDHPRSMRNQILAVGARSRWEAACELKHTVLFGETGFRKALGMDLFEHNSKHPAEGAIFDKAMRAKAQTDIAAVLSTYDFSDSGLIVDVGGGSGHMLAAILEKTGGKGVLFDLPAVAERVRGAGSHRFEIVAGDFFADPLPQGDTYLLMQVLHDWADDEAVEILTALRKAARPNARLLVIEMVIPEGTATHPAHELDLLMMVLTGGRERTQAEYSSLMSATGWSLLRVISPPGPSTILESVAV